MRLTADDLCLDVAGTRLVGPIDLSVGPGALLAIVGPNGAGKSTLLRLLAGDARPSAGSVTYDTRQASHIPVGELARLRSVLAQHQSEDVAFSVEEVVGMGRYALRMDPTVDSAQHQNAIDEAIASMGLGGLEDRPVARLSGGERQRTAIARTLAQDTPVVLLDEPTTALDIGHQQMVLETMATLSVQDRTVIAVLHDLNLAARFSDVILLDRGRLAAHGAANDVLTADRLSDVYEYPIEVLEHPLHGVPGPDDVQVAARRQPVDLAALRHVGQAARG